MRNILILVLFFSLHSCQVIGLTDDYGKLSKYGKTIVKPLTSFDNLNTDEIYKVNASQLKEEIKKFEAALQ